MFGNLLLRSDTYFIPKKHCFHSDTSVERRVRCSDIVSMEASSHGWRQGVGQTGCGNTTLCPPGSLVSAMPAPAYPGQQRTSITRQVMQVFCTDKSWPWLHLGHYQYDIWFYLSGFLSRPECYWSNARHLPMLPGKLWGLTQYCIKACQDDGTELEEVSDTGECSLVPIKTSITLHCKDGHRLKVWRASS